MRSLLMLAAMAALSVATAFAEGPMEINVPVAGWQAQPGEVRPAELPRPLTRYEDGRVSPPVGPPMYSGGGCDGEANFCLTNERTPALATMVWTLPLTQEGLDRCHYFLLTYAAEGIGRSRAPLNALAIVGQGADGKEMTTPLLPVAEVLNDRRWHTIVGKGTFPAKGVLRAQLGSRDRGAELRLQTLKLLDAPPSVLASWGYLEQMPERQERGRWEPLDLSKQYNDTWAAAFGRLLEQQGTVTDGVNALEGEPVSGIPFRMGTAQANLIRPAESKADAEPVEFLGAQMTRHLVYPPGRDDVVAVDIGRKASEVLFLMASEVPKGGGRYAIAPGPHDFNDIGALSVELQYETGEADIAFPYSLLDEGFTATRMAGVYVVAADQKRTLKRFVLHNRVNGNNHSLAAVTLNVGSELLLPGLVAPPTPPRVRQLAAPQPQAPYVRQEGRLLKLGNSACDLVINTAEGVTMTRLVNRWSKQNMTGGLGLGPEVRCGDIQLYPRNFAAKSVRVDGHQATITLVSTVPAVPLTCEVRLAVDGGPEVRCQLTARNTGTTELTPVVRFPSVDVSVGRAEDNWIFFPQYRNVLRSDECRYVVGNDRSFPMQFMDVFNPQEGVGLGLLTHNTDLTPLEYGIDKNDGAWMFVQTPEAFSKLGPGQTLTMPETVLLPHAGDWHVTMAAYQKWLASVRPVQDVPAHASPRASAQARDWFQKPFAMRVHLTKKAYSWAIPIYDPATRQYKIDEFMKADTEYLGLKPEIVHLGGWCDFDHEEGGDWLGGDYAVKDYTGGADNLRAAIRKLQDEGHIPVSLYMIPDRCRKTSEIGKKLGRKVCTVRYDGWVGDDGPLYYTCCAYQPWVDHYVEAVKRTQAETGVKAIYVDVFGFSQGTACYSKEHGHPVPSNPKHVNRDLIKRLREALPPDVALWTEFPLDDLNAQYVDGNIHYYCLNWHEYFSETYDAPETAPQVASPALNAYRFAFPHTRQWIFLCGSEGWSSECKFPFFNGEPLYDVSWFLYAGSNLALVRNALRLQTKYADCFSSATPTMEVPTERWEVHANEFPAKGRTAWTLYNARYTTVNGPVLKIAHVAGATYLDAWSGRPLKPVISGKTATIALRLEPQAVGCVVQERGR